MEEIELLIIGSNNKSTGGIPRYIPEQLKQLPDSIHARVYDIGAPEGSGWTWFGKSLGKAFRDAALFPFQSRPDVVHVHTSHYHSFFRASFYALYSAHVWHVPVVLHVHGSSFDEFVVTDSFVSQTLQRAVYAAVDEIIVLSEYWRDQLALQVDEEKIRVVPNAIDPSEYSPSFDTDPLHIVFISNLISRKGVAEFSDAIDRLLADVEEDVRVSIAGKGPLEGRVRELADKYDAVTYHGYVSEEKKRELLNDGSIYVLPTYAEGLPIAILEAMAGGNAIISTPVGSIPEVIGEENGALVAPGDVTRLVETLNRWVESPDDVRNAAERNRELVEERYSWSVVMNEIEETYADVVRGRA